MTLHFSVLGFIALALAAGLVAGVFLTFSDFVMRALFASSPAAGSEAMQLINRKVYASIFMVLLMGLVPITMTIAGYAYLRLDGPLVTVLGLGAVLYVFGVFFVTVVGNVPMNQTLDAMPQGGPEAQAYWPDYVRGWTLWNHLRWIASAGTAICYMLAAVLMAQSHVA